MIPAITIRRLLISFGILIAIAALQVALVKPLSSNARANTTAETATNSVKLLTAKFEPREVVQVEVGDFHFKPGQPAPVHTHRAPAVGYVAKGTIIYQVEGEEPRTLEAGDAFFEPAGPRILRFDNASATEEAIFLDLNLEQSGEPFIVFEKPPIEAIDRRALPTIDLGGKKVEQVDIYASLLQPGGILELKNLEPVIGLVAEGSVELRINDEAPRRIVAPASFFLLTARTEVSIVNPSSDVPAKVITFRLI